MAPSFVADTSWVYALLDGDDVFHQTAKGQGETADEVHIPVPILVETMMLVKFRAEQLGQNETKSVSTTRAAMSSLARRPNFRLASPDYDHDATIRIWESHARLSYPDAAAIAAARRQAVVLLTFDERQRSAHRSGSP